MGKVLETNPLITTLNLSRNVLLGSETVDVIAQRLPNLRVLRNYHRVCAEGDWLNNDSLIRLVNQCPLKVLGLYLLPSEEDHMSIIDGIKYAIHSGLEELEINKGGLSKIINNLHSDVTLFNAKYKHHVEGSCYERVQIPLFGVPG